MSKLLKSLCLILILLTVSGILYYCAPEGRRVKTRRVPERVEGKLKGKVVEVADGDTITVMEGKGRRIKCRLYGIDAPEVPNADRPGQPYGIEAKEVLSDLIYGKTVQVETTGERTYDREVCHVHLKNEDINLEMVKRGYAWAYRHYLSGAYASEYIDAEREAREKRRGLWKQSNPQPPWEFRQVNRYERSAHIRRS